MEEARGQKQQTKVSQRKLNQVKVGAMTVLHEHKARELVAVGVSCWSLLGRMPRNVSFNARKEHKS